MGTLVPNLTAKLLLDDEELLGCMYFAGPTQTQMVPLDIDAVTPPRVALPDNVSGKGAGYGPGSSISVKRQIESPVAQSHRWVNGRRLGERFGRETITKMGGLPALL